MFVEAKPETNKMLSMRVDDEMFYTLKALSQRINISTSVIMRLAVMHLLMQTRENPPNSWDELKAQFIKQEQVS
jgi:predicted transcriptional regulator